jgi:hypothetical protein
MRRNTCDRWKIRFGPSEKNLRSSQQPTDGPESPCHGSVTWNQQITKRMRSAANTETEALPLIGYSCGGTISVGSVVMARNQSWACFGYAVTRTLTSFFPKHNANLYTTGFA